MEKHRPPLQPLPYTRSQLGECENRPQPRWAVPGSYTHTGVLTALPGSPPSPPEMGGGRGGNSPRMTSPDATGDSRARPRGQVPNTVQTCSRRTHSPSLEGQAHTLEHARPRAPAGRHPRHRSRRNARAHVHVLTHICTQACQGMRARTPTPTHGKSDSPQGPLQGSHPLCVRRPPVLHPRGGVYFKL